MTITANKYVKALGALEMPVEVMNEALEIYDAEPCLAGILKSPAVYNEQKYAAIDRIFPEQSRNLLKVLCRMEDILEELVGEIWDEDDRVVENIIPLPDGSYSVNPEEHVLDVLDELELPYTEEQEKEMKAFLCEKYGVKDVNLEKVEDASLIGGFVLEVDGSEYDWSLRGRIAGLRNKLAGGE